ncbi:MaoC family dehydratase [Afipia birgiae]|jgi:acyl dehydratase|uniref:MaoC family dehydratase n=1 Tax=Afipia birgiae TaxID=151414 RepID=UPI00030152A2|nr:MaoC family dehydratase [Afipia birgiae]MBX9820611.1 MaoC family dehydratase [Afipia birgiae]
MPYFDDIKIGDRRELGSFTFTPENIKAFATKFDPQPFHLDEEAGRKSVFGGLAASGWHVAAVYMKLTVASFQREAAELIARGEKPVATGPSPGFRELKWIKPVLAGDTLTYASEVTSMRPLESRPQFGFVGFYNTGVNQRGELAFSFMGSVFAPRRPAA